jgi:hypothetical protein
MEVPFTSQSKLHEFGAEKPISWAEHVDFFTINFTVWSHILSTGEDGQLDHLIWVHNPETQAQMRG